MLNMAPIKPTNKKVIKSSGQILKKGHVKPRRVISGQLQKKLKNRYVKRSIKDKGLVLIRHIPHGFYEEQIKAYFEQFGTVTRVRVVRSKRTGSPKCFAYVEFQYPEVAKVAAETMDNYLMFQKLVKAVYIPPEQQRFNYFKTSLRKVKTKSGVYKWLSSRTASIQRKMMQYNNWSEENYTKRTNSQLNKIKKLSVKFSDLGIDINQLVVKPNDAINSEKESKSIKVNDLVKKSKLSNSKRNFPDNDMEIQSTKSTQPSKSLQSHRKNKHEKMELKKNISLNDLLGDTIQEDSDDEDYILNDKNEKSTLKKNTSLKDLLGDTIQENFTLNNENTTLEKYVDKSVKMKKTNVEKSLPKKSLSSSNKLSISSKVKRPDELRKRKTYNCVQKVDKNRPTKLCKENVKNFAESVSNLKSGHTKSDKKGKNIKKTKKL